MLLISSPENKPFRVVPIDDVPLNDVLLDKVPIDDELPDDVPLGDIYVPIDDVPPDDVPLDGEPLGEVPPDNAPPDNVPPDNDPLDDVVDNSTVCVGAFPMAGCLINELWGENIFSSCCDNSTIKSIMQADNRNFKANFLPAIV